MGAESILFAIQLKRSIVNDINSELINCYQVIKEMPEELIILCQQHKNKNSKEYSNPV